ncbi:hypothetical protein Dda_2056 [Drechslerella dactyloides]|uniref:BTB domain-containing protein n=1 Tax=Drechslerella dactyloides TaxID=74499 RepID=A0AAD6J477_DREDA|nr:hypothetical protein Dda_2056 [Drechslerella dactyloides]
MANINAHAVGGPPQESPEEEGPTPTAEYFYHSSREKKGRVAVTVRVEGKGGDGDVFEFTDDLDPDQTIGEMQGIYFARAPMRNHPRWTYELNINEHVLYAMRRIAGNLLQPLSVIERYLRPRLLPAAGDIRHARIHTFIRRGTVLKIRIFDERGVQKVWDENLRSWRNAGDGEMLPGLYLWKAPEEERVDLDALIAKMGWKQEPLPTWSRETTREPDINFARPPAQSQSQSQPSGNASTTAATTTITTDGAVDCVPDTDSNMGVHIERPPPEKDYMHSVSPVSDLLITLRSGAQLHRFLVSSQILRVVSPVWRRYLDPETPFRRMTDVMDVDGRPHSVMSLADDDDDPETLLSVLHVLHFSTEAVPSKVDFAQLRAFAVLCDKYDCVHILRMWSRSWLDQWAPVALEPGYEDWLFIAKVFGDERNVKELEVRLVEESSSLSECGSYFLRGGTEVPTTLIPEAVLNRVMKARTAELQRQIGLWRRFLQTFVAENSARGCQNWDCVTLSYGSLIRSVEQSGLVLIFNHAEQWHGTIRDFEDRSAGIHLANGTRFHGYGWCPVENLNVALRGELERQKAGSD